MILGFDRVEFDRGFEMSDSRVIQTVSKNYTCNKMCSKKLHVFYLKLCSSSFEIFSLKLVEQISVSSNKLISTELQFLQLLSNACKKKLTF